MKILLIWGGWKGHAPAYVAEELTQALRMEGDEVTVTSDFAVLINENLSQYDVIVPIWSCGLQGKYYLEPILKAVERGVGLATFHGGINWFEDERYARLIGATYIYDTDPEVLSVSLEHPIHPICQGLTAFRVESEKYYMQLDPTNQVLATANYSGVEMPVAWTRMYGSGRIFYSTLAHDPEQLCSGICFDLILNGIQWCGKTFSVT